MFGGCTSCRSRDIRLQVWEKMNFEQIKIIIAKTYQRETFIFQVISYFMFESNYIYLWILINVQNKNLSVFFLSVKSERKRVMEVLEVSWAFTEERVQNNLTVNEVLISSSWITVIKGVKQITRVFSSVTTVSDGWMMVK